MKSERYRETLIVIDFVAYDKQKTEFMFDCTYEQAVNHIWKNVCATAVILFAWQYGLHEPVQIKIGKKKLTDEELNKAYRHE